MAPGQHTASASTSARRPRDGAQHARRGADRRRRRRRTTVFVVGESGIGKTHLVEALVEHAAQRGFTVAIGRAYPVETGVPYAVFSDALLPLLRGVEPSVLTLLTRGGTAELVQLFPALESGGTPTSVAPARGDPAELKARLLWNFTQFSLALRRQAAAAARAREPAVGGQRVARDAALRRAADRRRSHRCSSARTTIRIIAGARRSARTEQSLRGLRERATPPARAARRRRRRRAARARFRRRTRASRGFRRAAAPLDRRQSVLHRRNDQGARRERSASRGARGVDGMGRRGAPRAGDDSRSGARACSPICRRTRRRLADIAAVLGARGDARRARGRQ